MIFGEFQVDLVFFFFFKYNRDKDEVAVIYLRDGYTAENYPSEAVSVAFYLLLYLTVLVLYFWRSR